MDIETAFQASRWEILETLAYRDASATEIAKRTKLSLPNVSQQARLLEAAGLLRVRKGENNGVGKPRMIYQLKEEIARLTLLRKGFASQRSFTPSLMENALLNILLWQPADDHFFLMRFLTEQAALSKALGVSIVDTSSGELHFLVLARSAEVDELRGALKQHAIVSPFSGKKKNMVCWVHSPEEVQDGIGKRDGYYLKLVSKMHPLLEQERVFRELVQ